MRSAFLLLLGLAAPSAALAAGVTEVQEQGRRVLVLDFRNDNEGGKNAGAVRVVSDVVASALADEERLKVVTSKDLERVVGLEAERAVAGCDDDDGSCFAELADALDADYVVFGSLGALGAVQVATVTVLEGIQTIERFTVSAPPEALPGAIQARVRALTASLIPSVDEAPAEPPASSTLLWSGVGVATGGAVLAGVFAIPLLIANDTLADPGSSSQDKASARLNGALSAVAVAVGLAGIGVGTTMAIVGGIE